MVGLEEMEVAFRETAERSQARAKLTGETDAQKAWDAMLAQAGVDPNELQAVNEWIEHQSMPIGAVMQQVVPQLMALMSTAFAAGFVTGRNVKDRPL